MRKRLKGNLLSSSLAPLGNNKKTSYKNHNNLNKKMRIGNIYSLAKFKGNINNLDRDKVNKVGFKFDNKLTSRKNLKNCRKFNKTAKIRSLRQRRYLQFFAFFCVISLVLLSSHQLIFIFDLDESIFNNKDSSIRNDFGSYNNNLNNTNNDVKNCITDPFALKTEGNVYNSSDAIDWNYMGNPGMGSRFVDIASGSGTTAGYIYLLRNDGKVYFTDRGTNGWHQYGYNLPEAPSNTSYVGITAGADTTSGYVYIMRSDGKVWFTDRGTNGWNQYGYNAPEPPSGSSYVGIASGTDNTAGYIYILRNDGRVFFTDRGTKGWHQYGYGSPSIPSSNAYVDLAVGADTTSGYVYVLRNDGKVYFTDRGINGWTQYGYSTPEIPESYAYVDIASGSDTTAGYVYVLRNDGKTYFTDRGTRGWHQYGYDEPEIPQSTAYLGITTGSGSIAGYIFVLHNDGIIHFTDRGTRGWYQYGYGSPSISASSTYVSLVAKFPLQVWVLREDGSVHKSIDNGSSWTAFGDAGSDRSWVSLTVSNNYLYALRNDGTVVRSGLTTASWSSWSDVGTDTSWVGITIDLNGYLYALRSDGIVKYATENSSTWISKGDAGSDTSWVDIAAMNPTGHVYTMRNDREIVQAPVGITKSWTTWATAGEDTSWVAIVTNDTYVFTLRNDGRIDRRTIEAPSTWNSPLSDVGTDKSFVDLAITVYYPEQNVYNVDKDKYYVKIQDAIDDANPGDTIQVSAGTYYENVIVNKTISLIGYGSSSTIINGSDSGDVVEITANFTNITGFKMTNSGNLLDNAGVQIFDSKEISLTENEIVDNKIGILLNNASNNLIKNNVIKRNEDGIIFRDPCDSKLVLWNKMGSASEIQNSEVGPNGKIIVSPNYVPGKFGKAVKYNYNETNVITFTIDKDDYPVTNGTCEFWYKIENPPSIFSCGAYPSYGGFFPMVCTVRDSLNVNKYHFDLQITGNDGDGNGGAVVNFENEYVIASTHPWGILNYTSFLGSGQEEKWHHYAIVWNQGGIPGVDNGAREVALYIDGTLVTTRWGSDPFSPSGFRDYDNDIEFLFLTNSNLGIGGLYFDNLKIWNYPKTNFSDKLVRGSTLNWIENNIIINNSFNGIFFENAANNTIKNNIISNNVNGIKLNSSYNNYIINNKINSSKIGISPVTSGLIGYWKMDEGSGTTVIDSISNNNGTIYGGATWTTGIVGGALSFDGSNDYVRVLGPLGSFSNEITVEAWMKIPNPYKLRNTIVGSIYMNPGLGTNMYLGTGNFAEGDAAPHFAFMIDGKRPYTVGNPDSIKANIWHHLAGIYDGSYMKLYLDGELVDSTAATGNIRDPTGGILIGYYNLDARHYFNGTIDEVRIFNRALSEEEIRNQYLYSYELPHIYGLNLIDSNNNSISDNLILNNDYGIYLNSSRNNTVKGNNISSSNYYGISLHSSSNSNRIIGNNISNNYNGLYLNSSNCNIINNNIIDLNYKIKSISSGLVGYWKLDENNGSTAYDETSNNNHGVINGTTWVDGRFGKALKFDGDNDYVNVSHEDSLNITQGLTVEAWIKLSESSKYNSIISKASYSLKIGPDNKVIFNARNSSTGEDWTLVEDSTEYAIYSPVVFNGYLYVGTQPNGKIFRSSDGTTWTEVGDTTESVILSLAVFNDYLYAGSVPNGKIYRSSDGTTWTEVVDTAENQIVSLAVFNGYLYAGTRPNGKIYRTYNGTTWTVAEDTSETHILTLAVFNGYLYAGTKPSGKIFRSSDGTTWTEVGDTPEENLNSLTVFNGYLYAGSYYNGKIYRSSNGTTWTEVEDTSESHIHSFAVFNGYLYAGSGTLSGDGGRIYRSSDGTTWTEVEDTPELHIVSLAVFNGYLYTTTLTTASTGKIYRMGGGFDLYSNNNVSKDEWTHIVGTYNGSVAKIYLNSVLDQTLSNQITIDKNILNLLIGNSYGSTIGGFSSTGEENFYGTIDEVRIFNRALSEEEIRKQYLGGYGLYLKDSNNNVISDNLISNNDYGVFIHSGIGNKIYHNSLISNANQAYDAGSNNNWDNGTIGNYWNDYTSRYPMATNDGTVWDTAYTIDGSAGAMDNKPLVNQP